MKLVAIIPAYNEEDSIGEIIELTRKYTKFIMVVDNNSTDKTVQIARSNLANVYLQPIQGQGAAVRVVWDAIKFDDRHDAVITLDSDGQHNPNEIPILLNALKEDIDIVIGSRFIKPYKIPMYRKFGIDVINLIYNFGYKQKLNDTQSCFRLYSKKAVEMLNIQENGFSWSTEILIKARKLGLKIIEVPITCIYYKDYKQNSTLNPVVHGVSVALKTLWWRIKLWN